MGEGTIIAGMLNNNSFEKSVINVCDFIYDIGRNFFNGVVFGSCPEDMQLLQNNRRASKDQMTLTNSSVFFRTFAHQVS